MSFERKIKNILIDSFLPVSICSLLAGGYLQLWRRAAALRQLVVCLPERSEAGQIPRCLFPGRRYTSASSVGL